jgi:2-polyprenyl-6-methoxyphenol hydroxylase-like FAD-dependent oxidoreductase
MSHQHPTALIVGGGIVGSATSVMLARAGFATTLVERGRWEALGHGITMIGPALRALDHLDLLDASLAEGFGVTDLTITDVSGTPRNVIPLPRLLGDQRPGLLGMMRPTLHCIIADAARHEGVTAREGTWPTTIRENDDCVHVELSDGSSADYDLVVGADGYRSWVRDQLIVAMEPAHQSQGAFRAVLSRPEEVTGSWQAHGHPQVHPGFTPTGPESMYLFCVVPAGDSSRPPQEAPPELLREHLMPFGGLFAQVRDLIEDPAKLDYRPFETLLLQQAWNRGRIVVLGDAAHATTPHLAAGAAMGLEDVVVLGEELQAAGDIPDGLDSFYRRRFERCKYVVDTSIRISELQTTPQEGVDPTALLMEASQRIAAPF